MIFSGLVVGGCTWTELARGWTALDRDVPSEGSEGGLELLDRLHVGVSRHLRIGKVMAECR